jgi:hypothetical protein
MAFSLVGVVAPGLVPFSSLSVMVEVDGDRENALSGPRCVSLSSAQGQSVSFCQSKGDGDGLVGGRNVGDNGKRRDILLVSFHDMVTGPGSAAQRDNGCERGKKRKERDRNDGRWKIEAKVKERM